VPAYLPGTNPYLREYAERYGLPQSGVRGGADTIYPEFRLHMEKPVSNPAHCTFFCTCMNTGTSCPEIPPKPPAASPVTPAPAGARTGSNRP
jgi:hypothetical protein